MYSYDQRPGTRIADVSERLLPTIREAEYAVLVGKNNCGKSWLLKTLTQAWGQSASYLGPARYQNFNLLGYYTPNRNRRNERWNNFQSQWRSQQENLDNSPVNLQQAIAELSDAQRETFIEIIRLLLGVELEIRNTVANNSMSQKYVSCDGHNISFTSSGFRLIATLVTSLLDTDFDAFLIDEPELGISPEAQGLLADFLFDREHRARYFSHIRTVVFATHSTIFLDRRTLTNNFVVRKLGDEISLAQVSTQAEFNQVHFFLLGNRFETLYLPSIIVIVEGKSDYQFISRVLALRYPKAQVSVIAANSDSRIKEVLSVAKGLFSDLQKSPYRDRMFVVLDAVHSASLPEELARMGVPATNIISWPQNGIEYYYPPTILDAIYGGGAEILIEGDRVTRNGIVHTKTDLAERVIALTDSSTRMHPEFERLFLTHTDVMAR